MQPVSDEFLGLLRSPHVVVAEAVIEPPGADPVTVPVIGGSVTIDGTAAVRRHGTLTVPWTVGPQPGAPLDLRTLPYGAYVVLRRGIRLGGGARELVQLGRLRVDAVSTRATDGTATLELSDRMAQVGSEPLLTPFVPTTGATAAIVQLVHDVFGDTIAYHRLTDEPSEPPIVDGAYADDRVKAINDLAGSVAAEAYFDANGDLVVAPAAHGPPAVWDVDAGLTGVLVDVDESFDRTETANGVLVSGQAAANQAPISALVVDDDPASPTRWGGPFGKVAIVLQSAAVQTVEQAAAQATAELSRRLTLARSLTLTVVPNPALEPGDVIHVRFPDGRDEQHVILSLNVPLDASTAVQVASRALDAPTVRAILADAWRELAA